MPFPRKILTIYVCFTKAYTIYGHRKGRLYRSAISQMMKANPEKQTNKKKAFFS